MCSGSACIFTVPEKEAKGDKGKVQYLASSVKVGEAGKTLESSNMSCGPWLMRHEVSQGHSDPHRHLLNSSSLCVNFMETNVTKHLYVRAQIPRRHDRKQGAGEIEDHKI